MLRFDTEDLMEQVDDFSVFVDELRDYSWRLTNKELLFLECVLLLKKEMVADEGIRMYEELIASAFFEEEVVDRQMCSLEENLKALRHKKDALATITKEDVAKLLEN
ncbi:hypothetical protein TSUD_371520 [Trifolium subterraneum]|uniref:Uncharacterized protein n=1 Tax=Trifolium subterraneum TaxID=3900 RepID=A0A2Z6NQC7_TRISU|nr:hypothetical protein TSUD_371520 [Trifolium subterraneum]